MEGGEGEEQAPFPGFLPEGMSPLRGADAHAEADANEEEDVDTPPAAAAAAAPAPAAPAASKELVKDSTSRG